MIRKPDPKKEEQDRLQNILLEMLKEEENKYCADCNAKTPRWAAWNLGVFICIRCAGIHRNLGVHISKVRSVTLDSWTAEQVQSMRVMANEKARKVYEHSLPEHFRRSLPDHQMEQFIRAKYDQKRYMLQGFTYPRIDISELPKPGQSATKRTPVPIVRPPGAPSVSSAAAVTAPGASVNDLLDFSAPPAAAAPAKTNGSANLFDADLAGLSISEPVAASSVASADLDDMFGSFVGAETPVATAAATPAAPAVDLGFGGDLVGLSMNTNGNGLAAGASALDDKRSTADIMSLFGSAPAPATQIVAPGGFAAFGIQAHAPVTKTPSIDNSNGLGSLAGLNFGMPPAAAPAPMMAPQGMPMMPQMGGGMPGMGSAAFPNPFGAPSAGPAALFTQSMTPVQPSQASPTSPSYPVPNKANAFADLSLGKVMGLMGSKPSSAPAPAAPPPAPMNFDDLLGL